MPKPSKLLLPRKTTPQIGFTSDNQPTQKQIQLQKPHPQTGLIKVSPPHQQDNENPLTLVQQLQDPNLNISNIDLSLAFYSVKLN